MLALLRLREKASLNVRMMHSCIGGCQRHSGECSKAWWGRFTTPDRTSVAPKKAITANSANEADTGMSFLFEEESMHTTRLTSSSSGKQILFITSKLVSHALDCRVPFIRARSNEVRNVLLGDSKQVLPLLVPIVDGIGTKKVSN